MKLTREEKLKLYDNPNWTDTTTVEEQMDDNSDQEKEPYDPNA